MSLSFLFVLPSYTNPLSIFLANADTKFTLDTEAVAKVAQVCNTKKDAARLAQEQSAHLFLCVLISQLTQQFGPVIRKATVIGVLDAAFDVSCSCDAVELNGG